MIRALVLCAALALLVPAGPGGVLLGAIFTSALLAGTALAGTFAASAIAFTLNAIVGSIISFAINSVVSALAGKPEGPKVTPFGINGQLRTGGDVPRSFISGHGMTAGSLVYANTWGVPGNIYPNEFLTQVIALSDLPMAGVTRLFVNGEPVSFATPGAVNNSAHDSSYGVPVVEYQRTNAWGQNVDYLWVKVYNGDQVAADPFLTGTVSSAERPWESTRVGRGVAYAVVTLRFEREVWSGVPAFRFECLGAALYDPTQDTTAGGSGAHRWNDPATWGGEAERRRLAPVLLYNLLRGIRFDGQWVAGLQGVVAEQLPVAAWRAAIDAAAAAGFRAGGEIAFDTELGDTVEALLASCEGRLADNAGTSYRLQVGAPGAAVAAITDDTIISTEQQSFTPFPGLADTVNGVIFTYPRPTQAWEMTQAPPIYDATLEAEDGDRRLPVTIDMPMVSDDEQAQRLAKAALKEARRARRHTLTLPPEFWPLEPGDVVAWTSTRNGYDAKMFRVDGIVDLPNLDVLVDLTETDPADYDWESGADFVPVTTGFLGAARPEMGSTSVGATGHTITVAGVGRRPAILLMWTNAPGDVLGLDWQVRIAATGAMVAEGTVPGIEPEANGSTPISTGLVADTQYEIRARWVPSARRKVAWSSWLVVTTPDVRLGVADFASSIEPVGLVLAAPLPTVKSTEVIYYAPDGKLYRWDGAAYTAEVDGGDIAAGSIVAGKIAAGAIGATEIAAGAVTADKADFTSLASLGLTVANADIQNLSVNSLKIANEAVDPFKLRGNAVSRPYGFTFGGTDLNNKFLANVFMERAGYVLVSLVCPMEVDVDEDSGSITADLYIGPNLTRRISLSATSGTQSGPVVDADAGVFNVVWGMTAGTHAIQMIFGGSGSGRSRTGDLSGFALGVYA